MKKKELEEILNEIYKVCTQTGNCKKYGYAYAIGKIQAMIAGTNANRDDDRESGIPKGDDT